MNVIKNNPVLPRPAAEPRVKAARRTLQFLELELAGQLYGIPLRDVQEVVAMAQLAGPPDLPAVIAGFLNLEGEAIPVLRLDRMLRLAERPPGMYTPLIVLRARDGRLALMAERVNRIRAVAEDAVLPLPESHTFNDCVEGMVTEGERVLLILAPARLLLEKEQQCLAELQDREQQRLHAMGEARS
jgi:purine-binding chemotaxis protein CheW